MLAPIRTLRAQCLANPSDALIDFYTFVEEDSNHVQYWLCKKHLMKTLALVVYRNCYVLKMVILNLNTAIVMRRRVNLHDLWQKEIHNSGWRL